MLTNTAFHDGGRGPIIIGVLWTLTIIASSIIAARFYVRRKLKALYWDDWLMLMALVRLRWLCMPQKDDSLMVIDVPIGRHKLHH
jgi:hypothetical protein